MQTATIIQHIPIEDLGSFEAILCARGVRLEHRLAGRDPIDARSVGDPDLLVVLGGPLSVNDTADFPFLREEVEILRARLQADRPCLGVCLGAQLISVALGGQVRPMPSKEIGWAPLELEPAPNPLAPLASAPRVLHWHGEEFSLPRGAQPLASSPLCANQAFQWRERTLALQFHPEVTPEGLETWYIGHISELRAAGVAIGQLRADSAEFGPAARAAGRELFERWLASIA